MVFFVLALSRCAAITIGVRILGPALGFILGSLCTMLYADLDAEPQITPTDPRWVGAWWLGESVNRHFIILPENEKYTKINIYLFIFFPLAGLVLISAMLILVSAGMFAFPRRLPTSRSPPNRIDSKKPSLKGKFFFFFFIH